MLKGSGLASGYPKRLGDIEENDLSGIRFLKVPVFLPGGELHRKRGLTTYLAVAIVCTWTNRRVKALTIV